MKFINAPGKCVPLLPVMLLASISASAQVVAPELRTYTNEVTVPLNQVGASPAPTIPVNVMQAIQGGALEIRQSLIFTASTRRLSVRTFLVQPGSPTPTPAPAQTMLHESYEVNVEDTLWAPMTVVPPGTNPTINSLVITGRVASGAMSLFGNIENKLFVHSVGFTGTAAPVTFNNVTTNIAGTSVLYATSGRGTLAYGPPGGLEPGNGEDVLTVTPSAGSNATTALPEITLSALVEHSSGSITYSWRNIGKSAAVIDSNTSTPRVQFGEGFGEYVFQVTVTDNTGATATGQVRVQYVGR